ncbi:MAG: exodeoxyribonuclease VII large subunit [Verrucomicrobia bacterium]|nr:MAG: exodeoxyribonuclease VII large subunit [Verrucomicrobiota bacterium]
MRDFPYESSLRDVLSVSALNQRVKTVLQRNIPPGWVRGEISNLRRQASGHIYFSLKDEKSQISAVAFRGNAMRLGLELHDGMQVILYGEISVYEPRGTYQLIVRAAIEDGVGRLQLEFERLKKQLADEGLFDPEQKKPLPEFPRTIGFVTSPTGAAIQDFLRILKRRDWTGRLIVLPVKVQGTGAGGEIVAALELAQRLRLRRDEIALARSPEAPLPGTRDFFDLLVVGRGGGSIEDLWAFNEETVARAVAACRLPVISSVGHEIDFTLSDFAADIRAETPSAAAELISSGYLEVIDRLQGAADLLDQIMVERMRRLSDQVVIMSKSLELHSPASAIERGFLRVDDLRNQLNGVARGRLQQIRQHLERTRARVAAQSPEPTVRLLQQRFGNLGARLERSLAVAWQTRVHRLEELGKRLESVGPDSVLQRGYALVSRTDGRLVARAKDLEPGDGVVARFADGPVPMRVGREQGETEARKREGRSGNQPIGDAN